MLSIFLFSSYILIVLFKVYLSLKFLVLTHQQVQNGFFFFFFWATPATYGSSQPRGQIAAAAAGPRHSHSHAGSRVCLQPSPQLTAVLDP